MKTKAQEGYEKVIAGLTQKQKDDLIFDCMATLDSPRCWDAETIEFIAEHFTNLGFEIRDPNNEGAYEQSELNEIY